jgi:hypothetical protein
VKKMRCHVFIGGCKTGVIHRLVFSYRKMWHTVIKRLNYFCTQQIFNHILKDFLVFSIYLFIFDE